MTTTTAAPILELVHGDCLTVLRDLPDGCIDLITADLPYGCTSLKWDCVIDLEALWAEMRRVLTDTGTVVAHASGRFTFAMAHAGLDLYKHSLVWQKSRPSQPQHSRNRPMVNHEDILVFSKGTCQHANRSKRRMTYNPINAVEDKIRPIRRMKSRAMGNSNSPNIGKDMMTMKGFERTIQYHPNPYRPFHPTAKPESLLEWIISSYSNPGDLILDPTCGGGTSGVAAVRLGRGYFGIERDEAYFDHARDRILAERDKAAPALLCLPAPAPANDTEQLCLPAPRPAAVAAPVALATPPEPSQMIHGDCLAVMRTMEAGSVDLVVTSPPYNMSNGPSKFSTGSLWKNAKLPNGYASYSDDLPHADYVAWQKACLAEMWRLLADDGAIMYNHKPRVQGGIMQTPLDLNPGLPLRQIITWKRPGGMNFSRSFFLPVTEWIMILAKPGFRLSPGASSRKDVWEFPPDYRNDHPAPFPVELPLRCIGATNASRILDPFAGSGTTGVAAKMLDRRFIGIELDASYCAGAEGRIRTCNHAVKLAT